MIGRRLAQSLAQQNWTAISIEFVLLVAGVFLAIQAANWNQEREARSKAAIFTVRLHEDLRYELWGEQVLIEYYSAARKHAELALQALSGKHPLSDLYETTARKAQESEYRRLFRESLPFDVQNALLQKCGDRW